MASKKQNLPALSEEQQAEIKKQWGIHFTAQYTGELDEARKDVAQALDSLEGELRAIRSALCPRGNESTLYSDVSLRHYDEMTDDLKRAIGRAASAQRGLDSLEQWTK